MPLLQITAFLEAVKQFMARSPIASSMNAAEWEALNAQIRQHAFWSARQNDQAVVNRMQQLIGEAMSVEEHPDKATMDRSKFVTGMRDFLGAGEGDSEQLTDITSRKRLELIYNFNTTQANEFGRAIVGNTPAILKAFPCQELIRVQPRRIARPWTSIWQEKGGRLFGGRMIALKGDPIWVNISRFGTPYPPFDYSSGMGVRDVGRSEAVRLGVIKEETQVKRPKLNFAIEEDGQ